jgi:hypothetical protein
VCLSNKLRREVQKLHDVAGQPEGCYWVHHSENGSDRKDALFLFCEAMDRGMAPGFGGGTHPPSNPARL